MPDQTFSPVHQPFQTFGVCLTQWMERQKLNIAQLSALTGQKSRTTIVRLMRDECSPQRCAAFLTHLMAVFPRLPESEWLPLQQGLEASRLGSLRASIFRTFDDLVFRYAPLPLQEDSPVYQSLTPLLEQGASEGICFGCLDSGALSAFHRALQHAPAPFRLRHYIPETEMELVCAKMAEFFPLLANTRYEPLLIQPDASGSVHVPWQNALLLRWPDGSQQLLLPRTPEEFVVFRLDAAHDLFRFYEDAIADTCHPVPFRKPYGYNSVETFGRFLQDCLEKEKKRALYYLKPDIGTEYMPTEVLADSLRTAMETDFQELQPLYTEMRQLYVQRFRNLYTKHKPTYLVLCREAMNTFIQTGVLSDHPFCLRPFTPAERLAALEHLILQAEKNPFFHLRILKAGVIPSSTIIAYDGLGVLTCAPGTDYNPSPGYTEMMLSSPGFIDCYRDFFLRQLLPTRTETPEISLHFMKRLRSKLIRMVKNV